MSKIELSQLGEHITKANKVLVITNKNSFFSSGFDQLITKDADESQLTFFHVFGQSLVLEDLFKAYQHFHDNSIDLIIGIGGGIPMNFAKSLHYFLHLELGSISEMLSLIQNPKEIQKTNKLILIPTTSGSGSDATHFSEVFHHNKKHYFTAKSLYPDHVILDEHFTRHLPQKITAYTAIDALSHTIESFCSLQANDISKTYALAAFEIIINNIRDAVFSPTEQVRQKLLEAAHLAGKAIDTSGTTASHALAGYLTKNYNIPHGQAVGNLLPYFMEAYSKVCDLSPMFKILKTTHISQFNTEYIRLLKDLDLFLNPLNIIENKKEFLDSADQQDLARAPIQLSPKELKKLLTNN